MNPEINIFKTSKEMFEAAAAEITALINYYISKHNRCSIVLSGGSTPKMLYEILGDVYDEKVAWDRVFFFWSDERCVPPDDDESNYKMANDLFLSKISVPETNIFRIPGEKPHDEAAAKYEAALKHFFEGESMPSFNIIILGVGNDGHIASIFPGTVLDTKDRWVESVYVEKLKSWRITLTLPAINNSENIIFIVQGKEKSQIINKIINDKSTNLPARMIKPVNGKLMWFLDSEAGLLLK